MALAAAGADVGLWAPDHSVSATCLVRADSPVRRLTGTVVEAMAAFGKADVLHDNGIWLAHHHRLAAEAAVRNIPRLVSTRGMLEPWAMHHKRWKKQLAWRLYQRRDLVLARCHHATAEVEAKNLRNLKLGVPIRIIPNGVDLPEFGRDALAAKSSQGRVNGKRIALFLGRIYPVKGLPMLVRAWAMQRPAGWELRIVGPDEAGHQAEVERLVAASGLGHLITFLGPLEGEAKKRALLDADLFVLPTYSENFGMAVAEALAHGLPVLTTKGAPWPMLEKHRCGWWVDTTVDGIALGLRVATSLDSEALGAMGENGRKLVSSEFGWPGVAKQFMALYEDLKRGSC
jgi:glycosyltransferase involved in cell wall biosynthesis